MKASRFRRLETADLPAVLELLRASDLPTAGVGNETGEYLLAEEDDTPVAVVGLEVHGNAGLLRSLAVDPASRSGGVAVRLVDWVVDRAVALRLTDLYLLTTTAANYFPRFGFRAVSRSLAPAALHRSAEFQGVCPDSAVLMHLSLQEKTMLQLDVFQPNPNVQETNTFLSQLRAVSPRPLEFRLHGEPLVPAGYHVTEVKAVAIEAMDCGGQASAWRETVIQLMNGNADEARQGFMSTAKFLGIYDRVAANIPVRPEAALRVEYGTTGAAALQYHVGGIEVQPARVVVDLSLPGVACKASGARSLDGQVVGACCAPAGR